MPRQTGNTLFELLHRRNTPAGIELALAAS